MARAKSPAAGWAAPGQVALRLRPPEGVWQPRLSLPQGRAHGRLVRGLDENPCDVSGQTTIGVATYAVTRLWRVRCVVEIDGDGCADSGDLD